MGYFDSTKSTDIQFIIKIVYKNLYLHFYIKNESLKYINSFLSLVLFSSLFVNNNLHVTKILWKHRSYLWPHVFW